MFSAIFSLLPSRFSRPNFSLFVLAASVLLLPFAERASAQTFGGSNPITVSGTFGLSKSSTVSVSGISGTVSAISVTFNNLNVTGPNGGGLSSLSMALKPPSGTAFDLLGGPCDSGNTTFTLADSGDTGTDNSDGMIPFVTCPSAFSGTYLPADYYANFQTEVFNADSSGGPTTFNTAGVGNSTCGTLENGLTCGSYNFTSAFGLPADGTNFNGTWTLYIANQDDTGTYTPSGSLGSWTITFTTETAAATTTSLSTSNNGESSNVFTSGNGAATPVTFTATVYANNSPIPGGGTVTFYDSTGTNPGQGTALTSPVAVNGSGQAQANVSFSASEEGSRTISAVYSGVSGTYASSTTPPGGEVTELTVNHPYNNPSGSTTFCNGPVTVDNNPGAAGGTGGYPYPSKLVLDSSMTQLNGTIQDITVTLNGLQVEVPNFMGFLLQAPNSNAFEFMSWADGNGPGNDQLTPSSLDVWLSDTGSGLLQTNSQNTDSQQNCSSLSSSCKPADDYSQTSALYNDTFPSPAPSIFGKALPTGSATFTSAFGGAGAIGTWQLYLNDWEPMNAQTSNSQLPPYGQLNQWCLNFTMQSNAHATTTSVTGSPNPATITSPATTASVNLTANVTVTDSTPLSDDSNPGTVTFTDGATTLGTANVSSTGVATLSGVPLAEGTHQIVASYSGTDTGTEFGISTGTFDQRVDTATTISTPGPGAFVFCNTGAITAPGLGNDTGPASPYPSNIFVTGLPGTVKAVRVTLNGFQTTDQSGLLSLLVGPGGNNLDFFSLTGSDLSTSAPSPFNLTFADGGASISGNLSSSGTFAPTSLNTDIAYPQCPPNAPLCGSEMVGPPLASNPFTPTNKAATAGTGILGNADAEGVFGGTTSSTYNGNGTWSLYLDDGGPLAGDEPIYVNNGWCVSLTQNLPTISVASQSASTFTQGATGSFPVTITNEGAGPIGDPTATTANAMTVVDTLPTGLTFSGSTGTDWSCSASGQTVTCTNQDTVAADASFNQLTINVNVSGTASGALSNNTVSVSDTEASNTPTPSSGAVTIDVPPTIGSAANTTFTVGTAGSFSVTTALATYPTASISENGALPSVVTLTDNGNGTATLAGTPGSGTGGQYPITITAQNGTSPNATQNFTLTVDQAPAIGSANSATFTVGTAGSFTVTSAAGTYPTATFSEAGALPSGVTLTSAGVLFGTPATGTGGGYPITITAQNGVSPNAMQNFTLNVTPVIPVVQVSGTLQFNSIPFGTNESLPLTITNIGGGTLTISPSFSGRSYFSVSGSTCAAGVSAGSSCELQVEFNPIAVGVRGDTLTLTTNGTSNPTVSLTGKATGVGAQVTELSFGTIPFGTTQVLPLTIYNHGVAGTVTIGTAVTGHSFKILTTSQNTCLAGVKAGNSCTLPVEFAPTAANTHIDTLTLTPSAGAISSTVELKGTEAEAP